MNDELKQNILFGLIIFIFILLFIGVFISLYESSMAIYENKMNICNNEGYSSYKDSCGFDNCDFQCCSYLTTGEVVCSQKTFNLVNYKGEMK